MPESSDLIAFPEPDWLAGYSDPMVELLLRDLSDEARQLYRRYLAEEVRAMSPSGPSPWRAFDRAMWDVLERRREARETLSP